MIQLPWQVLIGLIGLLALFILTKHWDKRDTDDRVQAARLDERRDQRVLRSVEIEMIRSLAEELITKIKEQCKCHGRTE